MARSRALQSTVMPAIVTGSRPGSNQAAFLETHCHGIGAGSSRNRAPELDRLVAVDAVSAAAAARCIALRKS